MATIQKLAMEYALLATHIPQDMPAREWSLKTNDLYQTICNEAGPQEGNRLIDEAIQSLEMVGACGSLHTDTHQILPGSKKDERT